MNTFERKVIKSAVLHGARKAVDLRIVRSLLARAGAAPDEIIPRGGSPAYLVLVYKNVAGDVQTFETDIQNKMKRIPGLRVVRVFDKIGNTVVVHVTYSQRA